MMEQVLEYAPFFYSRITSFVVFFITVLLTGQQITLLLPALVKDSDFLDQMQAAQLLNKAISFKNSLQLSLFYLILSSLILSLQFTPLIFYTPNIASIAFVDWICGILLGFISGLMVRRILRGWRIPFFTFALLSVNIAFSIYMAVSTRADEGLFITYSYGIHGAVVLATVVILYGLTVHRGVKAELTIVQLCMVKLFLKTGKEKEAKMLLDKLSKENSN